VNWWQRIIFVGTSIWPCYCIWMLTIHNFSRGYFINHHTYINFCQSTYSPRWSLSNSLPINFCQSTLLAANYFCWDQHLALLLYLYANNSQLLTWIFYQPSYIHQFLSVYIFTTWSFSNSLSINFCQSVYIIGSDLFLLGPVSHPTSRRPAK
jgi:hypothetical protein